MTNLLKGKKHIIKEIKSELHLRNKHRSRYDFDRLKTISTELIPFVQLNKYGNESIDFANPKAVLALNRALLKQFYGIDYWEIPANYLCPPIPGRADYIHYVADLLAESCWGVIPIGKQVKCVDIGVGANCIYPIMGFKEYGWSFVGTDIDSLAINSAQKIIDSNANLNGAIELRLQSTSSDIFKGIIKENERFCFSMCNPPFHSSAAEANAGNLRKLSNLNEKRISKGKMNFGGQSNELWCKGGELQFIRLMIQQSTAFSKQCCWFTTLVSKQSNVDGIMASIRQAGAVESKIISMGQGNKISRIIAWTFLNLDERELALKQFSTE